MRLAANDGIRLSPALVEFDNVCKTYDGEQLAVDRLNLSVHQGEFLTLLGPSGSGKTTALMMLAGFEAATSGEIRLRGRSLLQLPPHRRNMGVVFQNYALFPHLSVEENVAFPLAARRLPAHDVRVRVATALELVQLGEYGARKPAQLSGGQQQRVALARALVFDPDLILMDEPLGALDKQLRETLQIEIKQIQTRLGMTVVYVTHDQSEALTMSDRIAVFSSGSVKQVGTPQEIYEQPQSAFVAKFIGESNGISGTVVAEEQDQRVIRTDGGLILRALAVGRAAVSDRVKLSLRPERIAVGVSAERHANRFPASVERLIYHGDHTRIYATLEDGSTITARVTNAGLRSSMSAGDQLELAWHAEDCRAFVAEEVS